MNEAMKQCPFCAEMVPGKALKCRYCGEMLEDYMPAHPVAPPRKKLSACIILVIVGIAFLGLIGAIAAFVYPQIRDFARRAGRPRAQAREAYVAGVCSDVVSAQETYLVQHGKYATLRQLSEEGLVHPDLGRGRSQGYRFELELSEDGQDWSMCAWPERPRNRTRSYYVDAAGDVRAQSYTNRTDRKAGPDSPPLWDDWGESDWDD